MPQDLTTLINECVDISDNRKGLYLMTLQEVLNARILTLEDLKALRFLWANNSDSIYAFCELAKRIGSQSEDDNVLLKRLFHFAELKQLNSSRIHILLLLHLLWLPVHEHKASPIRSAMMLLHNDPIQLGPILKYGAEDGLIDISTLMPFSANKFHQQGVRIDENGMVFISQESIQYLNSSTPPRRPNVSAQVVLLTVENMDFDLIHRYYNLLQLIFNQHDLLEKSLDECIEAMRCGNVLPKQFTKALSLDIKKDLFPIHYHAEFDRKALAKKIETEKKVARWLLEESEKEERASFEKTNEKAQDEWMAQKENLKLQMRALNLLAPLQVKPSQLSNDTLILLLQLNSSVLTPFIVHFSRVGFDFVRLGDFGRVLQEKLNINWLSQQCLDFLMQVSPRELTDRAIHFFGETLKTDEKSTALALQTRFQFVLWFGEAALENCDHRILRVAKRFASSAADPYLRPAMLKWICDYGNIFSSSLTINLLVSAFFRLYPNHPALLAVVRETANQIELRVWEALVRESGSQENGVAILSLCKTALSKEGCDQIADWIVRLNAAN